MVKTIVIGAGVMRFGRVSAGSGRRGRYGFGSDTHRRRHLRHQLRLDQRAQKAAESLS